MTAVAHPKKTIVPLEAGLAWGNDGAIFEEKLDGKFTVREVAGGILAGELMPDGSFIAWDCVEFDGVDIRGDGAAWRLYICSRLCKQNGLPCVQCAAFGGDLLREVLARGGEGIVRKMPNASYYEPMTACKRSSIYVCRVVSIGPGQSVEIVDAETGLGRGRVALRGGKADQVRHGSVIRVEAMSQYESGALRQPNPCREWLVKF